MSARTANQFDDMDSDSAEEPALTLREFQERYEDTFYDSGPPEGYPDECFEPDAPTLRTAPSYADNPYNKWRPGGPWASDPRSYGQNIIGDEYDDTTPETSDDVFLEAANNLRSTF